MTKVELTLTADQARDVESLIRYRVAQIDRYLAMERPNVKLTDKESHLAERAKLGELLRAVTGTTLLEYVGG